MRITASGSPGQEGVGGTGLAVGVGLLAVGHAPDPHRQALFRPG
jgi:hypothetical protein